MRFKIARRLASSGLFPRSRVAWFAVYLGAIELLLLLLKAILKFFGAISQVSSLDIWAGFLAIAFYPACALKDAFRDTGYKPYAPLRVYMGVADEEVSPSRCAKLVDDSRAAGGDVEISLYNGASHGFDDPSAKRQGVEANAEATDDAIARAVAFFAQKLGSR